MRNFLLTLTVLVFSASLALGATALTQGITENGMLQGDLVKYLGNVRDLTNELQDDQATFRTVVADNKALLNQLRQATLYGVLSNPAFVINTNFDVKNGNAISYVNGGTIKSLSANTNFDTGTSKTITGSLYGAAVLTVNSSGTGVVTWASGAGYASEALAIAALVAPSATDTVLGYVTVQAHASGFTAGTDALTLGTGGNVATATTYYNSINPNTLMIGAAVSTSAPAALTNSTALTLNPN